MAMMETNIRHYSDAERFLDGKDIRKIGHNTYVIRHDDCISIKYHRTNIIRYFPNGVISLDTDGWHTVTTFDRLRQLTPFSFHSEGDGEHAVFSPIDNAKFVDGIFWEPVKGFETFKSARYALRKEKRFTTRRFYNVYNAEGVV